MQVDEVGFRRAMEEHRLASGAGEAFGEMGGEDAPLYRKLFLDLVASARLSPDGVAYNPYEWLEVEGPLLALVKDGNQVETAEPGDRVEVLLPETGFYVDSGGQVADTGTIVSAGKPEWEIQVEDMRKPAAGIIIHVGRVVRGAPRQGDLAIARVDVQRRHDIMRNHTATHLLHHELRAVLGEHARQAGSLVAPDRLRFDFTHPQALTQLQLERIEANVNRLVLESYPLHISYKPLKQAISEGATAFFGEKYGETVRNITIGEPETFSNELCGGTHVEQTGDIGLFLITSEGSAAAGIRRIEAVTGRGAYELVQSRFRLLNQAAELLASAPAGVPEKVGSLLEDLSAARKQIAALRQKAVAADFQQRLEALKVHASENITVSEDLAADIQVLATELEGADANTLRQMVDRFRQKYPTCGVVVLASVSEGRPVVIAGVTEDLVQRGLHAGELVNTSPPTWEAAAAGARPWPRPAARTPLAWRKP